MEEEESEEGRGGARACQRRFAQHLYIHIQESWIDTRVYIGRKKKKKKRRALHLFKRRDFETRNCSASRHFGRGRGRRRVEEEESEEGGGGACADDEVVER